MSNEIQNDDLLLSGGIGNVTIGGFGGERRVITKLQHNKNTAGVTITIAPSGWLYDYTNRDKETEDAEFEIVQQKLIEESNGK